MYPAAYRGVPVSCQLVLCIGWRHTQIRARLIRIPQPSKIYDRYLIWRDKRSLIHKTDRGTRRNIRKIGFDEFLLPVICIIGVFAPHLHV